MRALRAALAAALLLLVAACGNDSNDSSGSSESSSSSAASSSGGASTTPAPPEPSAVEGLTFVVVGSCTPAGGVLTGEGSGFTPNGPYVSEVTYPDGSPYVIPDPVGYASATGTTPNWQWPCFYEGEGDQPGTYTVTVTDRTTGRSVTTTFDVGHPE